MISPETRRLRRSGSETNVPPPCGFGRGPVISATEIPFSSFNRLNSFNSFIQALAALGLAFTLGCASVKPKTPRHDESPAASIDQINLLAVPVALNFDQAPGPDGF